MEKKTKDRTDRKEAEDALRASELKYRTVFEFANDAILNLGPLVTRSVSEVDPRP